MAVIGYCVPFVPFFNRRLQDLFPFAEKRGQRGHFDHYGPWGLGNGVSVIVCLHRYVRHDNALPHLQKTTHYATTSK